MVEVTLICTVYNEDDSIEELLDSLVEQTETPEQAVFVDGGSDDLTREIITSYAKEYEWIELHVEEGCNIAEGRNKAVEIADYDHIVGTDGGCVLDEKYVEKMREAFEEGEFIMGNFEPKSDSIFERIQGRILCSSHTKEELEKGNRGPSSRSVGFTKEVWEDAGGYPEDLYTGEDSKFNAKILSAGYEPVIAEEAMVYWKMRPTWNDLWKQFSTYGKGDAKGGNLLTHPSEKLGVSKNIWLYGIAEMTFWTFVAVVLSAVYMPVLAAPLTFLLLLELSVPFLYYMKPLKESYLEDGLSGLLIGLGICQAKYWAWYYGFNKQLLLKPSLIPYQLSEWKRLR